MTRFESGKLQLALEKVDLYKLIEGVVNDFQKSLVNRIEITINSFGGKGDKKNQQEENLVVLGDRSRLIQVVSNLLSNAIKFTRDSGTIKINIGTRAAPTVDSQKEAVVVISDQGQGIDTKIMPQLFEKFASKSEQGTGLGLYLSKKIVEAHGRTIC